MELKSRIEIDLNPQEREFIYLRYGDKLSIQQITNIFNMSKNSIYRYEDNILKKLKLR